MEQSGGQQADGDDRPKRDGDAEKGMWLVSLEGEIKMRKTYLARIREANHRSETARGLSRNDWGLRTAGRGSREDGGRSEWIVWSIRCWDARWAEHSVWTGRTDKNSEIRRSHSGRSDPGWVGLAPDGRPPGLWFFGRGWSARSDARRPRAGRLRRPVRQMVLSNWYADDRSRRTRIDNVLSCPYQGRTQKCLRFGNFRNQCTARVRWPDGVSLRA